MPLLQTLSDDFSDGVTDAAKWTMAQDAAVTVTETTKVEIALATAADASGYGSYTSLARYDLTDSSAYVEWDLSGANNVEGTQSFFVLDTHTGNQIRWRRSGESSWSARIDGDVHYLDNYDPVAHRWARIRHVTADDTIRWDTAPDGVTWTQRASVPRGTLDITSVQATLRAGTYQHVPSAGVITFDNFNTTGAAAGPSLVYPETLSTHHGGLVSTIVHQGAGSAAARVVRGHLRDASGNPTNAATGLTAKWEKPGGAFATCANGVAYVDPVNCPGLVQVELSPAERDTLGRGTLAFSATGAVAPPPVEVLIVADSPYEAGVTTSAIRADLDASSTFASRVAAIFGKLPAGLLPGVTDVTDLQLNNRVDFIVPAQMLRPSAGSVATVIPIHLYDEVGGMEVPDGTPAVAVTNSAGTNRAANLGAVTLVAPGSYSLTYATASTHAVDEQLHFTLTVSVNGKVRRYSRTAWVVDTYKVDFSAQDRADLALLLNKVATLHDTRLTGARSDALDLLAGINGKTTNLPPAPAAAGGAVSLTEAERAAIAGTVLDLVDGIETDVTLRQALRVVLALLAGKVTGAGTTLEQFRAARADHKVRASIAADAAGNRTAVTLDLS